MKVYVLYVHNTESYPLVMSVFSSYTAMVLWLYQIHNYKSEIDSAGYFKEQLIIDTLGTSILANTENKAVLLYDTEQSEVQLFKNVSNLLKRAKLKEKPEELRAFSLTGMFRKERLQAIVQSMDKYHYEYEGIRLVVIDGIADLVLSANDEAESITS